MTTDPKLRKQNEEHLKQCLNILQGVQAYIEEREEEKTLRTNQLDRVGIQSKLTEGLPELAMKKLTREKVTTVHVTDPRRFHTESKRRLISEVKLYKYAAENSNY